MKDRYLQQWNTIQAAILENRAPQALFFIAPLHQCIKEPLVQLVQLFHCKKINNSVACKHCPDCLMVQRLEHPDINWIKPEKAGSGIKIDQIRELQQTAFLSPQRSAHKIIILEYADKLNIAAGNALLKILEEPAQHTHFILIAEQISTVLPTILSRCQLIRCSTSNEPILENLLQLGTYYPSDSERFLLTQHAEAIINELINVLEKRQDPCMLAAQWSKFELNNLLWFLYLVYSQVHYLYINKPSSTIIAYESLMKLKLLLTPIILFSQIDKIINISKKLSHNININHLLALEDLLLAL